MRKVNLSGERFDRLLVTREDGKTKHGNITWRCKCDCGNEVVVSSGHLRNGHTRSCGCLVKDLVAGFGLESRLSHGHSSKRAHTPEYATWHGMIQRCENPNHSAYQYYGERGIGVCERWRESFDTFLSDMGEKPKGLSIDRIDNDGDYTPDNCRWATIDEQLANRRPYKKRKAA